MAPPQPRLSWRTDPTDPLAVWACWFDPPSHYTLNWGDNTPPQHLPSWSDPVKHTYPAPGQYLLSATADTGQTTSHMLQVTQPPPLAVTGLDLTARVQLDPSATQPAHIKIAWPDWDAQTLHLSPGEHVEAPTMPGARRITITDLTTSQIMSRRIPVTDPQDTYGALEVETDGRTISVKRTKPTQPDPGRTWHVYWGDEHLTVPWAHPTPLPDGAWLSHTYERAGTYYVEAASLYKGLAYTRARQVVIR